MNEINTTCGEIWPGEDWLPACHLPAGHEGDHATTATWPQYVPRPADEQRDPSAMERVMHSAWATTIAAAVAAIPAFVPVEARERVINRDADDTTAGA